MKVAPDDGSTADHVAIDDEDRASVGVARAHRDGHVADGGDTLEGDAGRLGSLEDVPLVTFDVVAAPERQQDSES